MVVVASTSPILGRTKEEDGGKEEPAIFKRQEMGMRSSNRLKQLIEDSTVRMKSNRWVMSPGKTNSYYYVN